PRLATGLLEKLPQPLAIAVGDLVPPPVRALVAQGQFGELQVEPRKVAAPRGGAEAEGAGIDVRGTAGGHLPDEVGECVWAVGDAGEDGHDVDSHVEPGLAEAPEGAQPRLGGRGARFDAP